MLQALENGYYRRWKMTNNIAKLYELAEVYQCNMPDIDCSKECEKCEDYNQFTPEKQLELIKLLVKIGLLQIGHSAFGNFQFCNFTHSGDYKAELDEALASFIIQLWNDLTDKQKEEIKEILK